MPHVALSVSLFVYVLVTRWAMQQRLNRLRADSGGPKEPCIRWGRDPPPQELAILRVVRHTEKHWESLLRCTQQKNQ